MFPDINQRFKWFGRGQVVHFLATSLVTLVLHPHPNSRSRTEPDVTDAIGVADDDTGDGREGGYRSERANPRGCFVRFSSQLENAWKLGKSE